ncbi:hypothetical protein OG426_24560 [Streptomyces canus]|uniref:hypothetical protein n=1 Tax=Streptomyces canus TaxID=58343 RepID=UPI00225870FB|nr:hypothetical protein [Streptomyces canus]MCX4859320.1 hypothetical protein [Streptomyces canus]WSW35424.1 hypothetical protein OG426_24560 [Streptomyces canus]
MASKRLAVLPAEVVSELEAEGHATRLPVVRAGGGIDADVVVTGMQVTAVLITFVQAPSAIQDISERLRRWWVRRQPGKVQVEVRGKNGNVRLELDSSTDPEDLAALLRLAGQDDQAELDDQAS